MLVKATLTAHWIDEKLFTQLYIDYEDPLRGDDVNVRVYADGSIWLTAYNEHSDRFDDVRKIDLLEFFSLIAVTQKD